VRGRGYVAASHLKLNSMREVAQMAVCHARAEPRYKHRPSKERLFIFNESALALPVPLPRPRRGVTLCVAHVCRNVKIGCRNGIDRGKSTRWTRAEPTSQCADAQLALGVKLQLSCDRGGLYLAGLSSRPAFGPPLPDIPCSFIFNRSVRPTRHHFCLFRAPSPYYHCGFVNFKARPNAVEFRLLLSDRLLHLALPPPPSPTILSLITVLF
jgi:hypothetical protein